jgi:hypothetical protein
MNALDKPALTIAEATTLTGFSVPTITRPFQSEPGVLVIARPTKMNKRRYRSVRIPRAVYERVIGWLRVK